MANTDVIQLRGLRLGCICGVLPQEQKQRQPYEFDVDVVANLTATTSDELTDTLDYSELLDRIEAVTVNETFQLFERLAQRIAEVVLADARVVEVTVEVRKLRPPVTQFLNSSGVRIVRRRDSRQADDA
ncbi:MAG: dihydroneopterin aldolase [Acidimicrobiia bacterium]|nr:dihydroneopterin aldolase [Acidimicrobiia bacterium]MCY4456353.1 dihydroneopterin aldolase [Acidimicrobiaceae bacterium]